MRGAASTSEAFSCTFIILLGYGDSDLDLPNLPLYVLVMADSPLLHPVSQFKREAFISGWPRFSPLIASRQLFSSGADSR